MDKDIQEVIASRLTWIMIGIWFIAGMLFGRL